MAEKVAGNHSYWPISVNGSHPFIDRFSMKSTIRQPQLLSQLKPAEVEPGAGPRLGCFRLNQ
jgi:hypothetical protein